MAWTSDQDHRDPLLDAIKTITWVILLNKPVYPAYVWYFVGDGADAALLSLLSAPAYAAILIIARHWSLAARIAFPIAATLDTIFEAKLFGAGSGAELFFAPVALITALSFRSSETRYVKSILVAIYGAFFAAHGHLGAPLHGWTEDGLAHLREINIFAVATLTVFVGWTFANKQQQP